MKYSNITPEGTKDFIFEEYDRLKELENRLCDNFEMLGYQPVRTPTVEFYDLFETPNRFIAQESMLKSTDLSGRILVLRPDSTAPIARVVSTKLKEEEQLKIYYNQKIYRQHPYYRAMSIEENQCGIEIIGGTMEKADLYSLLTAFESLKTIQKSFKIEIGHAELLRALLEDLDLSVEEYQRIKDSIASLNTSTLDFGTTINSKALEIVRILPTLYGGKNTMKKARELAKGKQKAQEILDYLEALYCSFEEAGYEEHIIFDMGIVQKIDYYTGLVFRGYVEGIGNAVLSGGRYDSLYCNYGQSRIACGFTINVSALAEVEAVEKRKTGKKLDIELGHQTLANVIDEIENAREGGYSINIEI